MMKKLILSALIVAGFAAQSASAADLPVKAPAYRAAPLSWAGFYFGGNIGAARNNSDFTSTMDSGTGFFIPGSITFINALGTGSAGKTGITGGVQIGYNWQLANIILGIEADINAIGAKASLDGVGTTPGGSAITFTNEVDPKWIATVRPRLGYAFDTWMVYVTGGLAILNADYSQNFTNATGGVTGSGSSSTNATKAGWDIGGGLEWMIKPRWSVKAEYLYAKFNGFSTSGTVVPGPGDSNPLRGSADTSIQMVRVGLNFHF